MAVDWKTGRLLFGVQTPTCDQDICEHQQAAEAEADDPRDGRQEEQAAGQFTHSQDQRTLQHSRHGYGAVTNTPTKNKKRKHEKIVTQLAHRQTTQHTSQHVYVLQHVVIRFRLCAGRSEAAYLQWFTSFVCRQNPTQSIFVCVHLLWTLNSTSTCVAIISWCLTINSPTTGLYTVSSTIPAIKM